MKIILLFLLLVSSTAGWSATCTSTSRNNYTTNQVLRSSDLNNDFNQLVTKANAFDGGCVTPGTLEFDALDAVQFAPILKALKEGCKVTYSSATQISISKCLAAVNGSYVTTTVATTAAFGCTGCSAEVASTAYYVYIQTGSTGSTLTPLILTTAPNDDGYDNSGNKVLARFYNNASSDIDQFSIDQWVVNGFIKNQPTEQSYTPTLVGFGTVSNTDCTWTRSLSRMVISCNFTSGTVSATEARIPLPTGYKIKTLTSRRVVGKIANGASSGAHGGFVLADSGLTYLTISDASTFGSGTVTATNAALGNTYSSTAAIKMDASVPIEGWD